MEKMKPRTLSGFMELLPAPQQQMERIMEAYRRWEEEEDEEPPAEEFPDDMEE